MGSPIHIVSLLNGANSLTSRVNVIRILKSRLDV
jgi:hypothetical protein